MRPSGGLIPAWAGKTCELGARRQCPRAHPRVGGENNWQTWVIAQAPGSSPRGRGKRPGRPAHLPTPWLIPAWAGKTSAARCGRASKTAHPRVGGENSDATPAKDSVFGSSPRGRGKPGVVRPSPRRARAHPRVGGENCERKAHRVACVGSSPRGRGKPFLYLPLPSLSGLIPAWAGKTPHPNLGNPNHPAHPRVGGENFRVQESDRVIRGSSPRGRGKLGNHAARVNRRGLIPAWAGKT